jgi:hypothetical protein
MQETERLVRFKVLFISFYLFFVNLLFAQVFPDQQVDSLLQCGIKNIINQKYSEAEETFTQLDTEFPELPFGKIYLAACKIAEAYDYAEAYDSDYIETKLEEAKEFAEDLLSEDENDIWFNYYYALAEGYIAYFDAIRENWFSALSTGMNSINSFGTCLNLDENFFEAYIAIGTYEYWISRKTEFLEFLPFYEDETKIGMDKLRTAVESASYNSYLATNSLIWIYIDQKDFNTAIELGKKAVNEFPDSRYFKWGLARAYEDVNPDSSIQLYYDILNSFSEREKRNHINEIILKHLIAQQYVKLGETERAIVLCDEILSVPNLNEFETEKLENRLDRVTELKNSLTQ